ncbi:MAG: glutamate racemase [Thermaerobacter sp.]|nr:glutamate racemase [Thermaerobacter sp.]
MIRRLTGPIAMFDSGEGGLTVLRQAMNLFPGEDFLYAADSSHFPYGTKPLTQVRQWFLAFLDFFLEKGAKAVVIACNTATAAALEQAQALSPVPVIGVISAGVDEAIRLSSAGTIGVLSTTATYRSAVYPAALHAIDPTITVAAAPCPILVTMVEAGQTQGPDVAQAVRTCTEPVLAQKVDTVILGCTHFPHMEEIFRQVVSDRAHIVDPGLETARILPRHLGPLQTQGQGRTEFFTTGDPQQFSRVASMLWPDLAADPKSLVWDDTVLFEPVNAQN